MTRSPDPLVRRVDVRGTATTYREDGHGPPVILVAGLGLSGRFYDDHYAAFAAAGLRLIVPDLPGYGATPGPTTGIGVTETATFLLAFAEAIGVERTAWIGHSLGAQAVVAAIAHAPQRARAVVLVGPTGTPGRLRLLRQIAALAGEAARRQPRVLRGVVRDYVHVAPSRYLGTWLRHRHHSLLTQLPAVHCPALLIAGDRDRMCPPSAIELLRHRLPHARVARVPGAGHGLPREAPVAFQRLAIPFLGGRHGGGSGSVNVDVDGER